MSELQGLTLYGIANCDQVRKARAWLTERHIDHVFHDFKKAGLPAALIDQWLESTNWEALLNRKSTTWRGLPDSVKAQVTDAGHAKALMQAFPSVVKRPVVEHEATLLIGFDPAQFATLLPSSSSSSTPATVISTRIQTRHNRIHE